MVIRGFRSKIALHVFLLVLLSALVTDALVIIVVQDVLVRNHINHQRLVVQSAGWAVLDRTVPGEEQIEKDSAARATDLFEQAQCPAALIVRPDGRRLYAHNSTDSTLAQLQTAAATALRTGLPVYEHLGVAWAVYWWQPERVLMALPLARDDRSIGSIAAIVPLTPLYARLRQYNKPVFIYIVLNTLLLSIVGLYRIFRIYLRPIDRIIHQADDYDQDDDLFFSFRQEDNELNRLSSALNRMLKKITEDKNKLQETVASLQTANGELKRAQDEIIRAEKMASVGRLAAGIAHEIGNPLGIVLGYLDLIRQPDLERSEHDDFTQRAEKEVQRINTIIRQLLDLARPKESLAQAVSAHAVIADIVDVLACQPIMAGIQLETALAAAADCIWADEDQLRQVFLNLLLNAADAIRGAGRGSDGDIRIATASELSADQPAWIIIMLKDNGQGIHEDQIGTIFDPFYTTKEPGKGTGLGLSVSYMIIEEMGGAIAVKSRPGAGTTFTIRLPLFPKPPAAEAPGSTPCEPQSASFPP